MGSLLPQYAECSGAPGVRRSVTRRSILSGGGTAHAGAGGRALGEGAPRRRSTGGAERVMDAVTANDSGPLNAASTIPLPGGGAMPVLGMGTWQLRGRECREAVRTALTLGYRHLDTAEMYGNEAEVGAGLRDSGVRREEVFLTTKVWPEHFRAPALQRAADESLRRLGVAVGRSAAAALAERRGPPGRDGGRAERGRGAGEGAGDRGQQLLPRAAPGGGGAVHGADRVRPGAAARAQSADGAAARARARGSR